MHSLELRGGSSRALRLAILFTVALVVELETVHGSATAGDQVGSPESNLSQDQRINDLEQEVLGLRELVTRNRSMNAGTPSSEFHTEAGGEIQQASAHIYDMADPKAVLSPPKYPTVKVTGFFQADVGWVHQDRDNRRTVGDVQDGADFRRARLAATGDVWENVGYMLEMDFAFPGRPSFMDVWLEIRDLACFQNIRVGQYRQPIGMDGQTSVRELTFIERSLPFAFLPFRQIGVMTYGHDEDSLSTWAVSAFRFPTDFWGGEHRR